MFGRINTAEALEAKSESTLVYKKTIASLALLGVAITGCSSPEGSESTTATQEPGSTATEESDIQISEASELEEPSGSGTEGMFGGIASDTPETQDSPLSRQEILEQTLDQETGIISSTEIVDERFKENSEEIIEHLINMKEKDSIENRENYPLNERTPLFWRGNSDFGYYDPELDLGLRMVFQNPLMVLLDNKLYLTAPHLESNQYVSVEIGTYDPENDYLEWTGITDVGMYSILNNPESGQQSLGRIESIDEQTGEIIMQDIYEACLRSQQVRVTPAVHLLDSNNLKSDNLAYGKIDEYLYMGYDDDAIQKDSRVMTNLGRNGLSCEDARE